MTAKPKKPRGGPKKPKGKRCQREGCFRSFVPYAEGRDDAVGVKFCSRQCSLQEEWANKLLTNDRRGREDIKS